LLLLSHALIKDVSPFLFVLFTSAPFLIKNFVKFSLLFSYATNKGNLLLRVGSFKFIIFISLSRHLLYSESDKNSLFLYLYNKNLIKSLLYI